MIEKKPDLGSCGCCITCCSGGHKTPCASIFAFVMVIIGICAWTICGIMGIDQVMIDLLKLLMTVNFRQQNCFLNTAQMTEIQRQILNQNGFFLLLANGDFSTQINPETTGQWLLNDSSTVCTPLRRSLLLLRSLCWRMELPAQKNSEVRIEVKNNSLKMNDYLNTFW